MGVQSFDVKKDFGTSVRARRGHLGISQEELAGRAGLHRTYVCDVERGARNVTLRSIEKLAQALEIPVASLLTYSRDMAAQNKSGKKVSSEDLVDILYVEDNLNDASLAKEGLKNITNRVHVVYDGLAALNYLFGAPDQEPRQAHHLPHLILLDLGLPKVDGLEVLRRIKSDPLTSSIPVVVLTASARDRDLQASKQLGAAAYIIKPVDLQNLSEVTPQLNLQWALVKASGDRAAEPKKLLAAR